MKLTINEQFQDVMNLKFVDSVSDAYKSETYGTIYAYLGNEVVGYLEYTLEDTNKIFYIRMIETRPEYRGKGIATDLCKYVKNNYSEYEPDFGQTTAEGEKLRKRVTKTIPNNFYKHIKSIIDKMKAELADIETKLDNLYNKEDTLELQDAVNELGNKWQNLYDKIWDFEQKLQKIKPSTTIWTI